MHSNLRGTRRVAAVLLHALLMVAGFALCSFGGVEAATAACGDGIIDCDETCDDSNTTAGDGCNAMCRIEYSSDCPTVVDGLDLIPVSYWSLDDVGPTAVDFVRAIDGTANGGVSFEAIGASGSTGSSAEFNGLDSYIEIPHDPAFFVDEGAISLWFRADALPTSGVVGLFSKDATDLDPGGGHVSIYVADTGALTLRVQPDDLGLGIRGDVCTVGAECTSGTCSSGACTDPSAKVVGPTVATGTWYHVVATFGPAGLNLYVDGNSVGTNPYTGGLGTSSGGTGNTEPIALGASTLSSVAGSVSPITGVLDGAIDEVYFFDAQLGDAQVASLYGGESCTTPGGACTTGVVTPGCGDGVLDAFREECDDANATDNDGCSSTCRIEYCGDGIVNDTGETCDDGNRVDRSYLTSYKVDGCSHLCQVEPGWTCTGEPSVCTKQTVCGDGIVDVDEVCDGGAGCSADCQRFITCGDSWIDTGEACDDANLTDGDGCSSGCAVEAGWTCSSSSSSYRPYPSTCVSTCGDGMQVGLEACDDGNVLPGDGCDEHCRVEECGDGFVKGTEQCDDNNQTAGDGCSVTCQVEPGWVCPPLPKAGKCVVETVCDPAEFRVNKAYTNYGGYVSCPFNPTLDTNADGVPDCPGSKMIVTYPNVRPFELTATDTQIFFDAVSVSPVDVVATIEFAVATVQGGSEPDMSGFTTVVSSGTASSRGDTTSSNFDLAFTADQPYSFPGGTLIVRITGEAGEVTLRRSEYAGNMYLDYDNAYPWDMVDPVYSYPEFAFRIQKGAAICAVNRLGYCDPGTTFCTPPGTDFPQNEYWCGNDGGTAQNCHESYNPAYSFWSSSSYDTYDLTAGWHCDRVRLYRRTPTCNVNSQDPGKASCSYGQGDLIDTVVTECESCFDGNPCTDDVTRTYGCYNYTIAPTSCWDGPPSQRGTGTCSDGQDFCQNPGPECIGATYASTDVCDGLDNDCDATVDDTTTADLSCDDSNSSTFDECVAGACSNVVLCGGTPTSCGTTVCEDCTVMNGDAYTGVTQPCCNSGQSCTCEVWQTFDYTCTGGITCEGVPISSQWLVPIAATCSTCDDSNICTTDSCDVATGICSSVDVGYSGSCYEGPAGTEGVGTCRGGTETCVAGTLGACTDVEPTGETCDGFDQDCNGIVDDGSADASCPVNQGCWSGLCDDECNTNGDCAADEYCYFENGITPGRCAPQTGSCDDVDPNCPNGATCYEGSCTNTNCGNDLDCNIYSRCYNSGRCLNQPDDRCNGVHCANGEQCIKGACKKPCVGNADCPMGEQCIQGGCFPEPDPCDGIDCKVSEVCSEGGCHPQCAVDADCTEPGHVCWDDFRCAPATDPCFNIECAEGEICSDGACFLDCSADGICDDPGHKCYSAERCATNNCEQVQCSEGFTCQGGNCQPECTSDADCTGGKVCLGGVCKLSACAEVECAVGEVCDGGVCYVTCTSDLDCSILDPGHLCFGGFCTDDPCAGFLCPTPEQTCVNGACFDACMAHPDCTVVDDVCYDIDVCAIDEPDLCSEMKCPADQICAGGSCFYDCTDNADCAMYDASHFCFDGRCAADACENISCPLGTICDGGTCFQYCDGDADCTDPTHVCYDNACKAGPCDGVTCPTGYLCDGGTCFQYCDGSADCSDPNHVCYDNLCKDPCADVTCGAGEVCDGGTCFEYCDGDVDCSNPNHICYDNICVDPDNPECDGRVCPMGEVCSGGVCFTSCPDCESLPYDAICYQGACVRTDCARSPCDTGEVCHNGVCYEDCSGGQQCTDPNAACYDNRCARSACEAQAVNFLEDYEDDHLFERLGSHMFAWQYSSPQMWPRAYEDPGTNFVAWADVNGGAGASSDNDALYARGAARVVIYFDDTTNDYILYLIHGSKDGSQAAAEATYGIRVKTSSPQIVLVDDDADREGVRIATNGGGSWTYVQAHITTGASETGGVALGRFNANATNWKLEISASFSGGIDRWELMNGENGQPIRELDPGEPLIIDNKEYASGSREVQPDYGITACDTGLDGVCGPGTVFACEDWELVCTQTVYPWDFEICDGKDNTCNGNVDTLDSELKFAMVESRRGLLADWRPWPTVDSNETVADYMNYTPRGSNGMEGSTDVRAPDGSSVQEVDEVKMLIHRHMPTGQISMPVVVGAYSEDEDDVDDWGDTDFAMEFRGLDDLLNSESDQDGEVRDMYVCWYDDRKPANTGDEIPREYDRNGNTMSVQMDIEDSDDDWVESDSVVIRPDWLEAYTGRPTAFRSIWRGGYDDDDRRWRRTSPGLGELPLYRNVSFWVRIIATNPDEAFCLSDTQTEMGCRVGYYQCTAAGIVCGPPDDAACAAGCTDFDGDGHILYDPAFCPDGTDCDDFDSESHQGATEYCNGRDNDCNGVIDHQSIPSAEQPSCTAEEPCGPSDCGGKLVCGCPPGVREEIGDPVDVCICGESLTP